MTSKHENKYVTQSLRFIDSDDVEHWVDVTPWDTLQEAKDHIAFMYERLPVNRRGIQRYRIVDRVTLVTEVVVV